MKIIWEREDIQRYKERETERGKERKRERKEKRKHNKNIKNQFMLYRIEDRRRL